MTAKVVNAHTLTLEFRRFLSEAEWREVATLARELPYVQGLRADAVRVSSGEAGTIEVTSEQLAHIFDDIRADGDRHAAWNALSDDDRFTLFSLAVDEAKGSVSSSEAEPHLYSGGSIPREGLRSDTGAMRLAWRFLARRVGDGSECATCGAPENEHHEPTDECGVVANLLHDARGMRCVLTEILARAVATCEREGFGIEDTDDMIAIRQLAEAALHSKDTK